MAIAANLANPIPQEALPGQLLDVIGEITFEKTGVSDKGWLAGISWVPEPCLSLRTSDVDVCTRIDYVAVPRLCEPAVTQTAFTVYDAFKGATLEFDAEDIAEILDGRTTRKLSAAFAAELITGNASGGMSLSSQATAPTGLAFGSAATPVYNAFAVIESELARRLRGSQGTIHLPPGMLAEAVFHVELERRDGRWYTPLGNLVIADSGYLDPVQPDGGGGASAAGEDWIYASGPVRYRKTAPKPVDDGNIGSTMTTYTGTEDIRSADYQSFRTHNDMVRFMDVHGIFQFDPCPVTAVLATYSDGS